jgi:hypothetical protein
MITESMVIFVGSGKVYFDCPVGTTVSVLPFGKTVHIIDSAGLKYNYPSTLSYGECRGLSNIVKAGGAFVTIADGDTALMFINRGRV